MIASNIRIKFKNLVAKLIIKIGRNCLFINRMS